jgi:hypothetical protein
MYVIKRDNTEQLFDDSKIQIVLEMAFRHTNVDIKSSKIKKMVKNIKTELEKEALTGEDLKIELEKVQDYVEQELMKNKYFETAKHYIIYRKQRQEYREKYGFTIKNRGQYTVPWGPLGYITYKRTYARRLEEDNPDSKTEEYEDTVLRVLSACQKQLNVGFTKEELENAYKYFMTFKGSVAGRFLWQLGTQTVNRLGLASLQNCAGCVIDEIDSFVWLMDMLLLGVGVGYSVENKYISKLPKVLNTNITIERQDTNDADFISGLGYA